VDSTTQYIVAAADPQELRQYFTTVNHVEDSLIAFPSGYMEQATPACPEQAKDSDEGLAQPV